MHYPSQNPSEVKPIVVFWKSLIELIVCSKQGKFPDWAPLFTSLHPCADSFEFAFRFGIARARDRDKNVSATHCFCRLTVPIMQTWLSTENEPNSLLSKLSTYFSEGIGA